MRMRINELESLVKIHLENEEHERQMRLRLENEKDEWLERELEHARNEIRNQLINDHKKELEMVKARFKIFTQTANMERSTSEQSLEKTKVNIYNKLIIMNFKSFKKIKQFLHEIINFFLYNIKLLFL